MKSRTSFSKLAIFRKDITRYAPLWIIYTVIMLLVLSGSMDARSYDRAGRNMQDILGDFGIVNLFYAGVCGVVLFSDLFNTRMCYSLHAMPQRRETWFLSHTGAALMFSLVPNILAAAMMMVQLEDYWFLGLYWLLGVTMQFIFYFSLAALSAMLTGSRFAMLAVYTGLNFVSMLALWMVETIYLPQMYGVVLVSDPFMTLCPTVMLANEFEFFSFKAERIWDADIHDYEIFYRYDGLADGWGYTAVLLGLGILILGLAVVLYRLRQLESAGDFIAFRKLNGAACVIITLCFAGAMAYVGDMVFGSSYVLWLMVGLVVGFFGSRMLLERRVRVFRARTFIAFGVLAAVLAGSFLAVVYDIFGVVNWTPKAEEVKSVTVANYVDNSYSAKGMDMYYDNRMAVKLTEQEAIEDIILAHEDILERADEEKRERHTVVLLYELEDGRTVQRRYQAPADGENYRIIQSYLYTAEQILGYTDWESYVKSIHYLYVCGNEFGPEHTAMILEAVREDIREGTIQPDMYKYEEFLYWIEIRSVGDDGMHHYRSLSVTKNARNIMKVLQDPRVALGYVQWDTFPEELELCNINGFDIPLVQRQGFLEALKKDVIAGNISLLDTELGGFCSVQLCRRGPDGEKLYRNLQLTPNAKHTLDWAEKNGDYFG